MRALIPFLIRAGPPVLISSLDGGRRIYGIAVIAIVPAGAGCTGEGKPFGQSSDQAIESGSGRSQARSPPRPVGPTFHDVDAMMLHGQPFAFHVLTPKFDLAVPGNGFSSNKPKVRYYAVPDALAGFQKLAVLPAVVRAPRSEAAFLLV
jgi:hypothetical protein